MKAFRAGNIYIYLYRRFNKNRFNNNIAKELCFLGVSKIHGFLRMYETNYVKV